MILFHVLVNDKPDNFPGFQFPQCFPVRPLGIKDMDAMTFAIPMHVLIEGFISKRLCDRVHFVVVAGPCQQQFVIIDMTGQVPGRLCLFSTIAFRASDVFIEVDHIKRVGLRVTGQP